METEPEIFGAMAAVIMGLLGLVGVLLRRNNKGNPGHDLSQVHKRFDDIVTKQDDILLVLRELKTIISERLPQR